MAAFQATDDPLNGAPLALCTANDAFRLLAPASCVLRAGAGVPSYTFHRHDYHWLAISLSRCDEISSGDHSLDPVLFGTHVLSWDAMHQAVSTAVAAGFTVLLPSDASTAVKSALLWSVPNRTQLRALSAADFILLPPIVPAPPLAWWLSVTYSSWVLDGSLHALSHAIGFSGPIWEPATRDADSRLHLSMLLTQEFCPISLALPVRLYGDPAVRYYVSSMPPPQFLLFPTTVSRLHGALTTRWNYLHGNPSQVGSALATLLPIALKGLRSLSRFLNPSPGSSSQIAAFRVIAGVLEPTLEWHRYETLKQLDVRLAAYLYLADSADSSQPPLLAEERALALQQNVEGERDVITAAPLGGSSSRDEFDGPATQSVLKALVALKKHPLLRELELQLMQVWTPAERYPAEVFRLTLASRSWTCVSILFGHLSGVKEAGTIYAILEQASQERSYYFSVKLSVEDDESDRPDHTRWFTYPTLLDKAVRSPDFAQLAKFNLFGFGAQIRQLKEEVVASALDSPPPGTEFNAEQFFYHLTLLSFIAFWLEALGFTLEGKAGFAAAFNALSVFCQNGAHYRGSVLESHVSNMRRLYLALQQDMHSSFQCFFPKRQSAFDQFVEVDAMFLPSGNFYSTLRLLKDDVKHLNKLSRLGVIASPSTPLLQTDAGSNKKRLREAHVQLLHPSRSSPPRAASSTLTVYEPPQPSLGAFSWAIKEDASFIKVLGFKYAKTPILEKLGLSESQICLASYLSRKGAAACPSSTHAGHEAMDSPLHVFSEEALALRPSFEEPPYRVRGAGATALTVPTSTQRGRGGRRNQRGRSGRHAQGMPAQR